MYTFIREYSFDNKSLYCLLCFNKDVEEATKNILNEIEESGSICKAVIKIRTDESTINALKERKVYLVFDRNNKIVLRDKKFDDFTKSGLTKESLLDMQINHSDDKSTLSNNEDILLQYNIKRKRKNKKSK